MDLIIKHIIDIDRKADEINTKTQQRIEESGAETKKSIENMRSDIISNAKSKAYDLYEAAISEAKLEAQNIIESSRAECDGLERKFEGIRETVEKSIFNKIIFDNKRDNRE